MPHSELSVLALRLYTYTHFCVKVDVSLETYLCSLGTIAIILIMVSISSIHAVHQNYLKTVHLYYVSKTSLRYKSFKYHPKVKCLLECHGVRLERK